MVSALTAYKAIIGESDSRKSGQEPQKRGDVPSSLDAVVPSSELLVGVDAGHSADAFSVDLSGSSDVFAAVDSFFNLGKSDRFGDFHKLSSGDQEEFVKIVAALAKTGYAGYEELIVNNKIERHDIMNKMGDSRLLQARVYDESKKQIR